MKSKLVVLAEPAAQNRVDQKRYPPRRILGAPESGARATVVLSPPPRLLDRVRSSIRRVT